jgi:hypothetical protein
LEIWDKLYGYVMDVYGTIYQVYECLLEIPSFVVGFFEDIGDKIIDEILDIAPW